MLNEIKLDTIVPKGDRVLVDIYLPPEKTESGIIVPDTVDKFTSNKLDIHNYAGTVIAIGDKKDVHAENPGLKLGDKVLFSQFSGYHLPTSKDVFAKVIHSHDIHSKIKSFMKFGKHEVQPTNDRLVVEIIVAGKDVGDGQRELESGILVSSESVKANSDPREVDSLKAKVLAIGPNAKDYEVGDIVFIPVYGGNDVTTNKGDMLKTINYRDVLFKIALN